MASPEHDDVIFRASKDGNTEALQLTRAAAEERKADLEADGWTVEIVEIQPDPSDGPGAWSRWAAFRSRHARLRGRTLQAADETRRLTDAAAAARERSRTVRAMARTVRAQRAA